MFHKVMFSRTGYGCTAGLIVKATAPVHDVVAMSRLFPYSAARYMGRLHVSPVFETWDEAFKYTFPVTIEGLPVRATASH